MARAAGSQHEDERMSAALHLALIERASAVIADHADELTRLDQAIGDGDHGINMRRGFEAIVADKETIAALPSADALHKAGMTLVMKVGGAAGPLYGSLLMGMGKAAKAGAPLAGQLAAGVALVMQRGKADVGAKTMLDVLVPVRDALERHQKAAPEELLAAVRAAADEAREATRDMLATRGRASFLGERSRGHYDPGATSSQLLIHAVCDVLEARG
jgi:phosphoenolpyruvate---glycerone phosphotransferase subunit DhaL